MLIFVPVIPDHVLHTGPAHLFSVPAGRHMQDHTNLISALADASTEVSMGLLVSSAAYHQEVTCLLCVSR